MTPAEFKVKLAAIVCSLALLNKQISGHSFPGWPEAIQIELSTILTTPTLTSDQSYRAALPRLLQQQILDEPWHQPPPHTLLDEVTTALESAEMLDRVATQAMSVFDTDPTVYSVVRRGLAPIRNTDIIVAAVDATADSLGVAYTDLETPVRTLYYNLFRRLTASR